MKILHLINSIDRGGAENHLTCLARGQIRASNDIHIIYLKGNDYWYKYLTEENIRVTKIKNRSKISILSQIYFVRNYIKKFNIEIVHSHLPYMEIVGYFATINLKKIKLFVSKHVDNDFIGGSTKRNKSFLSDFINYLIFKKATNIIAISHAVKKYLTKNYFHNFENKIEVIYYGIDKEYINTCLNPAISEKFSYLNKDQNEIIFGYIGRLVKQKQVELIINSFYKLKNITSKKVKLLIVGDGPEKQDLKKLTNKLNLDKNVTFIDHQQKVGEIIKIIDVFCMNSKFEGLGLIMLEVMYFMKPIIAPSISAIPEVVKDDTNGLIVKPNDAIEYSNAMLKLTESEKRKKLSLQTKDILNNNFNFDIMVSRTVKLYK